MLSRTLGQAIALISYGNYFIRSGDTPNFTLVDDGFKYNSSVDFSDLMYTDSGTEFVKSVATGPREWIKWVTLQGCRRFRLFHYRYHHELYEGGMIRYIDYLISKGTWCVEAVFEDRSDLWREWATRSSDRAYLHLEPIVKGCRIKDSGVKIEDVRNRLDDTLTEIASFTAQHEEIGGWVERFEEAKSLLRSDNPFRGFQYPTLIPQDYYTLGEQQLLYSAVRASVGSGMGSYLDGYIRDVKIEEMRKQLARKLALCCVESIITVVNIDRTEVVEH